MTAEKKQKLRKWFESLDHSVQVDVALECMEELICTETIRFWESARVPYWEANGETLDGSPLLWEDEE